MANFLDVMKPVVDATIKELGSREFRSDPIAGQSYSRSTSIVSSAYKRHGAILERAILERLKENPCFEAQTVDDFWFSRSAVHISSSTSLNDCLGTQLPYGEEYKKNQIDVLVYDKCAKALRAYEIKRGNGAFDRGKKTSLLHTLLSTHMLLKSYGENVLNLEINRYEAKIVFYYGLRSLPREVSLIGEELDDHFGFPVYDQVERVNEYFREQLHALLAEG